MTATSSYDTASNLSVTLTNDFSGIINGNNSISNIFRNQNKEVRKFQKDLIRNQQNVKKWTKTQVDTFTVIREAELEARRYELERLQGEYEADLANKEAEIDAELREIQAECGELRVQIQSLEYELSEIKEQRKRDILTTRTEIAQSIKSMENREYEHNVQIAQLRSVMNDLVQKHQSDLNMQQEVGFGDDKIISNEINRLASALDKYKQEFYKNDDNYNKRMAEATSTIEMLKGEINSSQERTLQMRDEIEQEHKKLMKLQQELYRSEEQAKILKEQIIFADEQKKLMKNEVVKLDRSLWQTRKTVLLQMD